MATKRIIPCLDLKGGRVVKGVSFVELKDAGDPVELALAYVAAGADELALLNVDGSTAGRDLGVQIIRRIKAQAPLPLIYGGGIHNVDDMKNIFEAGADKITLNTAAVKRPTLVAEGVKSFPDKGIVVSIDAKKVGSDQWEVYIGGGKEATGMDVQAWARQVVALGATEILLTSIDQDGARDGYDLALTRCVRESSGLPVIASGGAGTVEHLYQGLTWGQADAVLAASIFHFGLVAIPEVKAYLADKGVEVNL